MSNNRLSLNSFLAAYYIVSLLDIIFFFSLTMTTIIFIKSKIIDKNKNYCYFKGVFYEKSLSKSRKLAVTKAAFFAITSHA